MIVDFMKTFVKLTKNIVKNIVWEGSRLTS